MELADFFIGKPGPGCISEALAKRLPVIVQRNAWTMAHERYNADWVEQMGVGVVVRNFTTELAGAVQTMLAAGNYQRFRARAAAMNNSAVYEIPDLLAGILGDHSPRSDAAPGQDACHTLPASRSWIGMVAPAQSTKALSPAACANWRLSAGSRDLRASRQRH
jgi:hypothetical protein